MKHILFATAFLLSVMLLSCDKEAQNELFVASTTLSFSRDGGSQSISLTTNKDWTASATASWLQVTASGSSSERLIRVTADANPTESARTATIVIQVEDLSQTVYVEQDGMVVQPPADDDWLCFSCTGGHVQVGMSQKNNAPVIHLQYSTDLSVWNTFAVGETSVEMESGQKAYFRADPASPNARLANSFMDYNYFTTTTTDGGTVDLSGNIMTLLNSKHLPSDMDDTYGHAFVCLFRGCASIVNAEALQLPANHLQSRCYYGMFENCTALVTAPELHAEHLQFGCYEWMFAHCTALVTPPALPAKTLAQWCYSSMFLSCTALTTAPELPATNLAESCYNCMFSDCTALSTAPDLPATNLAASCYHSMFWDCTALTTAPELKAAELVRSCYRYMFHGCAKLSEVTMLATNVDADEYLTCWLDEAGTDESVTSRTVNTAAGMVDAVRAHCPESPDWQSGVQVK